MDVSTTDRHASPHEISMLSGLDKSFSNVVVRWATIGSYLVARPKKWLPRNYFSVIKLSMYVETYEKRLL